MTGFTVYCYGRHDILQQDLGGHEFALHAIKLSHLAPV